MEAPKAETVVPVREEEQPAATTEQEINPWDVKGAKDAQGNTLAFDYVAISKCVHNLQGFFILFIAVTAC